MAKNEKGFPFYRNGVSGSAGSAESSQSSSCADVGTMSSIGGTNTDTSLMNSESSGSVGGGQVSGGRSISNAPDTLQNHSSPSGNGQSGNAQNRGSQNGNGQSDATQNRGAQNGNGQNGRSSNGNLAEGMHSGCGGRGDCLDSMPLAYVYAPDQQFRLLYSAKDALAHGTLFEELYKPMGVYGREH